MVYTRAMIPDYQTLLRLILECASSGEVGISDVVEQLGNKLGLMADERAARLPGSKQKKFAARVICAKSYLKLGGLVEITGRSRFSITDRGRSTLADKAATINNAYLGQFEDFQSFKSKMSDADVPTLWHLDDIKQEIIYCDLVEERYRDASELALRVQVARALIRKGEELCDLKQRIACYDLVDERYRDAPEPVLQAIVKEAVAFRAQLTGYSGAS